MKLRLQHFFNFWRDHRALPYLGIALLTVGLFLPLLNIGILGGADLRRQFYPWATFISHTVHETDSIPLWNPHQYLGYSTIGNPQYIMVYPPQWIVWFMKGEMVYRAITWLIIGHLIWSGWGMYVLLRTWRANTWGSFIGALVFAWGGYIAARLYAGHYTMVLAQSWLPWIIWGYWIASVDRRPRGVWIGGGALAFQIASGHPQTVYFTALIIGVGLAYLWVENRTWKKRWVYTRPALLLGLIGLGFSAAAWLPILEYSKQTARGADPMTLQEANEYFLHFNHLITVVLPNYRGNPDLGYWGRGNYEETFFYWGILPLVLIVAAWRVLGRLRWLFLALIIGGLWLSLGTYGGLFSFLYFISPLTHLFRVPERAVLLTSVGIAGAIAVAITFLSQSNPSERARLLRRWWMGWVVAVGIVVIAQFHAASGKPNTDYQSTVWMKAAIWMAISGSMLWVWKTQPISLSQRLTAAFIILDLALIITPQISPNHRLYPNEWRDVTTVVPPHTDYGRVWDERNESNWATLTGHYSIGGYDPLIPAEWPVFYEEVTSPLHPLNQVYGTTYVNTSKVTLPEDLDKLQTTAQPLAPNLYVLPNPTPRLYFATTYQQANKTEIHQMLGNGTRNAYTEIWLETVPTACRGPFSTGSARFLAYEPNLVRIQTATAGPSLLVIADRYDPLWQAWVDGEPAEIYRVDGLIRGICVPQGEHEIVMRYEPRSIELGMGISFGTASIFLVKLGYDIYRSRRRISQAYHA